MDVEQLKKKVAEQQAMIKKLEIYQRFNNLKCVGISEETRQDPHSDTFKMENVFKETMKVEDRLAFTCIRMRTEKTGMQPGPLLVKFERESDRQKILRYKAMLKGASIMKKEYLPQMVEMRSKNLLLALQKPRFEKAYIRRNQLHVKGQHFSIDTLPEVYKQK